MSEEDESWECIWPPEITADTSFVKRVINVLMRPELFKVHSKAWVLVSQQKGVGLNSRLTLLQELKDKSGRISEPFIDEAVDRIFSDPSIRGTSALASTVGDILLSSPSCGVERNGDDDMLEDTLRASRADDLYRGCVWEISAMMAACLIGLEQGSARIPASCLEPTDRARFISTFIV